MSARTWLNTFHAYNISHQFGQNIMTPCYNESLFMNMISKAMAPHRPTLPCEILVAPLHGGLSETASVWVLLHDLSEHEAKDLIQTFCPST